MKNLVIFLICFAVVIFQLSGEGVFFDQQRIPDASLALIIAMVLALGFKESYKWIMLTGILINSFSSLPFGSITLFYFSIAWLISQFSEIADLRSRKIFFLVLIGIFVSLSELLKTIFLLGLFRLKANLLHESFNMQFQMFGLDYLLKIILTIAFAYIYYFIRKMSRRYFFEPVRLLKKY